MQLLVASGKYEWDSGEKPTVMDKLERSLPR